MGGLPVFSSLRGYRRAWLRADLNAGVLIVAIVAVTVAPIAGDDPARYAALVGGLALLAGGLLLAAGAARLGVIADFLSEPVLLGYQAELARW